MATLVAQADHKSNAVSLPAKQRLEAMAHEAGCDKNTVTAADSWEEVADMIRAAMAPKEQASEVEAQEESDPEEAPEESSDESEEEESKEDEEDNTPAVGGVYDYRPISNKTGKPGKQITVEVQSVSLKKQTCTVKDLAADKEYKDVPWAQLIVS